MPVPPPPSPDLCRLFVLLARNGGSLRAAAVALGESVAALSKRAKPLHRGGPHLPRPWLRKDGRRFAVTDEGAAVLPAAADVCDRWDELARVAAGPRAGGLTVACGQEAAGGVVLRAAAAFRRTHPDSRLKVAVVRGRERIAGVAGGVYDVALVTLPPPAVRAAARRPVLVRPLAADELVLACAADSDWAAAFAARRPVAAAELAGWPLVLPEADSPVRRRWDEAVARRLTRPPQAAVEVGGWRVLVGYVAAGFGVGLVPRSVADAAGPGVRWRPLPPALRPDNRLSAVTLDPPANADLVAAFVTALE